MSFMDIISHLFTQAGVDDLAWGCCSISPGLSEDFLFLLDVEFWELESEVFELFEAELPEDDRLLFLSLEKKLLTDG
jgi:hypothetical protein